MTLQPALQRLFVTLATITLPAAAAVAAPQTICGFGGGDPDHGKAIYAKACASCHGANGRGVLRGVPDFTKKGGAMTKSHAVLEDHILHGFKSPNSKAAMPPRGGKPGLTDQDMKDAHAYLHKAFGCG